jgi:tRNA pseudouridine38-40 synthase
MPRYKAVIEYDGSGFVGWQRQATGPSIQQSIEEAIVKFCAEKVVVHGAGRTDAGVHALGQVAHFDLVKEAPAATVRAAINFHLKPAPIVLVSVEEVGTDFNARTSARHRAYLYRIVNRRAPLAIDKGRAWHVTHRLDASAMHEAAQVLVGKHDFTTFRASLCQAKSPVKTLDRLDVMRDGDMVNVHAEARSFLHHQVRNMVGTLNLVGQGKWSAEDVRRALDARDRSAGGPTCPPDGLYLMRVGY